MEIHPTYVIHLCTGQTQYGRQLLLNLSSSRGLQGLTRWDMYDTHFNGDDWKIKPVCHFPHIIDINFPFQVLLRSIKVYGELVWYPQA